MTRPANAPAYEDDFVAWLEDQAQLARRGETDSLDLGNIAEELEGMARGDHREIRNWLTVLLIHLLKCSIRPIGVPPAGLGRDAAYVTGPVDQPLRRPADGLSGSSTR
ncbi:MAG: DUF29 domain-containing protein [Stellaceae bacterium]